ncbi:MAG TPA: helix-turn-helix domain-containing protein [Gemmatimonadales bacterium]|nr:helix-turn-helix domain-containing protein [Gemmatimonadales bacterium]
MIRPSPLALAGAPSRRRLLELLKRRGPTPAGELARTLRLTVATVRQHLEALEALALVARAGTRRAGRGRPQVLWSLAPDAGRLFPESQGPVLADLVRTLVAEGAEPRVERFLRERLTTRRAEVAGRLEGLEGRARLREVARILAEDGFLAEVEPRPQDGAPVLRLCHCPVRDLVDATRIPCRLELAFVGEMLGAGLQRLSYIPDGDAACRYAVSGEQGTGNGPHPTPG